MKGKWIQVKFPIYVTNCIFVNSSWLYNTMFLEVLQQACCKHMPLEDMQFTFMTSTITEDKIYWATVAKDSWNVGHNTNLQ